MLYIDFKFVPVYILSITYGIDCVCVCVCFIDCLAQGCMDKGLVHNENDWNGMSHTVNSAKLIHGSQPLMALT